MNIFFQNRRIFTNLYITRQVYNLFQDPWNSFPYLGGWGWVQRPVGAKAMHRDLRVSILLGLVSVAPRVVRVRAYRPYLTKVRIVSGIRTCLTTITSLKVNCIK